MTDPHARLPGSLDEQDTPPAAFTEPDKGNEARPGVKEVPHDGRASTPVSPSPSGSVNADSGGTVPVPSGTEQDSVRSDFDTLQEKASEWVALNFPGEEPLDAGLVAAEEAAEASAAMSRLLVKARQGIRAGEDFDAKVRAEYADTLIAFSDYCTARGWRLADVISERADEVFARVWNRPGTPERSDSEILARPAGYTETDSARATLEDLLARGEVQSALILKGKFSPAEVALIRAGWEKRGEVEAARLAAEEARRQEAEEASTKWRDYYFAENQNWHSLYVCWDGERKRAERQSIALEAIARNAEAWHGLPKDPRHAAALAVIAKWARDPASVPEGIRGHIAAAGVSARYPGAEATPETDSGGLASEPRGTAASLKAGDKVIVCGSREGVSKLAVGERMSQLPPGVVIVHGMSPGGGVDQYADEYARALGFPVIPVPISAADRERARAMSRPKFAPIARNIRMYDEHPDAKLVIAFWNGASPGTKQMVDEGRRRGVPVELHDGTHGAGTATPKSGSAADSRGTDAAPGQDETG